MRMWMINPEYLCKKHLLGEHGELHKFIPSFNKKQSITGRIAVNSIEPMAYKQRHDALVEEMIKRGYNHKSPLESPDFSYLPIEEQQATVNVIESYKLLVERCKDCATRIQGGNNESC